MSPGFHERRGDRSRSRRLNFKMDTERGKTAATFCGSKSHCKLGTISGATITPNASAGATYSATFLDRRSGIRLLLAEASSQGVVVVAHGGASAPKLGRARLQLQYVALARNQVAVSVLVISSLHPVQLLRNTALVPPGPGAAGQPHGCGRRSGRLRSVTMLSRAENSLISDAQSFELLPVNFPLSLSS